jgi:hypothetical protein
MKRVIHGCRMLYGDQSNTWHFEVYESTGEFPLHSTIMSGTNLGGLPSPAGRLGTRRLPMWMDKLPVGKRRFDAVRGYHRAQYRAAYKLILSNLPRLFSRYRVTHTSMGVVSVDVLEPRTERHVVNLPLE